MRILITSCPSHGHLNPVLPLASAARRAGHEVVVATGAEVISEVERRGLPALLVGPSRAEADAAHFWESMFAPGSSGCAGRAGDRDRRLALTPDVYSADAVFSAAERLLAEPDFEPAAGGIRAEIDAMPGAADILDVLTAQEAAATHR